MKIAAIIAVTALLSCSAAEASDATSLVSAAARRHHVPVSFALRIAKVESGIKCNVKSRDGALGPLQIMPRSARALGYRNLSGCAAQTEAGMAHLAMCYRGAHGNLHRAAACHNQGISALHHVNRSAARYAMKVARN